MFTQGFKKQANAVLTAAKAMGMQAANPTKITAGVSRAALNKAFPVPSSPAAAVTDVTKKAIKKVPMPGAAPEFSMPSSSAQQATRHVSDTPYWAVRSNTAIPTAQPKKGFFAKLFG